MSDTGVAILDMVGNKLAVGDRVVYSTKGYGHSVHMLHGEVTDLVQNGLPEYDWQRMVSIKPLVAGRKAVVKYASEVCCIKVPQEDNQGDDTVIISKVAHQVLLDDSDHLRLLGFAGVDNWEGYRSLEGLREEYGEEVPQ